VHTRATKVIISNAKKSQLKDGSGIVSAVTRTQPENPLERPHEHSLFIASREGEYKISEEGVPVIVSCDCGFFTFAGCEYVLTKMEASFIEHSNGKPPHVTNPHELSFLCKHLTHLGLVILAKGM